MKKSRSLLQRDQKAQMEKYLIKLCFLMSAAIPYGLKFWHNSRICQQSYINRQGRMLTRIVCIYNHDTNKFLKGNELCVIGIYRCGQGFAGEIR